MACHYEDIKIKSSTGGNWHIAVISYGSFDSSSMVESLDCSSVNASYTCRPDNMPRAIFLRETIGTEHFNRLEYLTLFFLVKLRFMSHHFGSHGFHPTFHRVNLLKRLIYI
jgi:hypothetical protein